MYHSTRRTTLTGVDVMQHFIFLLHLLRRLQLCHTQCTETSMFSQPHVPLSAHKLILMQDHLHDVFVPGSALPKPGLIATHANSPIIPVRIIRARVVLLRHAFFPSPHRRHPPIHKNVTRPADPPWSTHYLTFRRRALVTVRPRYWLR